MSLKFGRATNRSEPPSSPTKFHAPPEADRHSGFGTTPMVTQAADGASSSATLPAASSSITSDQNELDDLERLGLERYMTSVLAEEHPQETKRQNLFETNGTLYCART